MTIRSFGRGDEPASIRGRATRPFDGWVEVGLQYSPVMSWSGTLARSMDT